MNTSDDILNMVATEAAESIAATDATRQLLDTVGNLVERLRAERDAFAAWKDSAMSVTPDMQEIGRLLDLPLGASIHDKIVPGIAALKNEAAQLREEVARLTADKARLDWLERIDHQKYMFGNWIGGGGTFRKAVDDAIRHCKIIHESHTRA